MPPTPEENTTPRVSSDDQRMVCPCSSWSASTSHCARNSTTTGCEGSFFCSYWRWGEGVPALLRSVR
ncbi:hypothetical protein AG1IA_06906 [Rhizoctonia solani AG-1 IA]|uniref:Uncharacterized protein n=1 Tax=Thanatephorus cucumeris (strain AG1-IA) TaxID=983506 RepID=L8WLL9_THACA|nr:hypothetical protein AG1IA_06906 [Rhizoctonia solani AG-1 IA]